MMDGENIRWPHDKDCEEQVVACMLLDDRVVGDCLSLLEPEDFFDRGFGIVFRHMKELAMAGKPIEGCLVADSLIKSGEIDAIGGKLGLMLLVERAIHTGSAPENAKIVREKAALRRLMVASKNIFNSAMSQSEHSHEIAARAHETIFSASVKSSTRSAEPASVAVPRMLGLIAELVQRHSSDGATGISFGLDSIDNLTGGLHKGQLSVLAGRPGDGKTVLATDIMRRAARRGVASIMFTLEMGTDEVNQRIVSPESGIKYESIQNGKMTDGEFSRISAAASRMMEWAVDYDDASHLTAQEIYIRTRMAKARRPDLALVVVDSLGLMAHGDEKKTGLNFAQRVGRSVNALREMAKDPDLGVSVLLIHHLNRAEDTSKRPTLRDLRDSGEIDQWAHNVFLLHPQGLPDSAGQVNTLFIAAKQRHRRKGEAEICFDGPHQTFREALFT